MQHVQRRKVQAKRRTSTARDNSTDFVWASDRPQQPGHILAVCCNKKDTLSSVQQLPTGVARGHAAHRSEAQQPSLQFKWISDYLEDEQDGKRRGELLGLQAMP